MSSLISESSLVFSPQLAATIGLEEAIMLQVLHNAALLQSSTPYTLSVRGLAATLAFWSLQDLQRVVKSLCDKGVIQLQSPPLTQTDIMSFLFDSNELIDSNQSAQIAQTAQTSPTATITKQPQRGANRISPHFKPNKTVLAQLAQHNISEPFIWQQVTSFVTYWRDRDEIAHSWDAKFLDHVIRRWQHNRADVHFLQPTAEPGSIQQSWQPSADAIEILHRNGINALFIEDAIPEFVLYWRERGNVTTTWNSKFIQHIKRQWAIYTSALKHDTEPRRIPANWQPSPEVFEILTMANIHASFAQNCLQEFVLYWKDTNQPHSSWNTKFLQHVKYCWANQHQLQRLNNEGQQNTSGSSARATGSFVEKHTDRSWAEGL